MSLKEMGIKEFLLESQLMSKIFAFIVLVGVGVFIYTKGSALQILETAVVVSIATMAAQFLFQKHK